VFELDKVTTIFTGDSKEEKKSEIPKRPTNPRTEPSQ
jgi:E3 ubiquitin-protein ligase RNF5